MKTTQKYKLKFIRFIDRIFNNKLCWADCVSWAFSNDRWNPLKIQRGCRFEKGICYCGRFCDGKAYDELTEEEIKNLNNGE